MRKKYNTREERLAAKRESSARQRARHKERDRERDRERRPAMVRGRYGKRYHFENVKKVEIPPHVLEQRDLIRQVHLQLNHILFGDPPPGRSAFDQRR